MNKQTGDIGTLEELRALGAKEQDLVPLTDQELAHVKPMNRKQRRAWAVEKRREERRARKDAQ